MTQKAFLNLDSNELIAQLIFLRMTFSWLVLFDFTSCDLFWASNQLITQTVYRKVESIQLMTQTPFQEIDSESNHDSSESPGIDSD